ncbi:MAG: hypothetical protein JST75_19525 [Bacteroidetes bacterium]|nr:hypothetical protein [Bacteroidota bacterium]
MADDINILEHAILGVLYTKPTMTITAHGSEEKGMTAIYKRQYGTSYLEFGVLVDILNNPKKYEKNPEGVTFLNQHTVSTKEVVITKYNWFEVTEAIEVLVLNGHVRDSLPENIFEDSAKRYIYLLPKGAIDYRNKFYLKQFEEAELKSLATKISRIEYKLKRYGFWYDILKGAIGGIIGAAITLLTTRLTKSQESLPDKQQEVKVSIVAVSDSAKKIFFGTSRGDTTKTPPKPTADKK